MKWFQDEWYCSRTKFLLIIYFFQSICGGISFHICLFLKSNVGLNSLYIGSLISSLSVGNIFGGYLGGYLADKYNPCTYLKYGITIQGLSLISLIFIKNFYVLLVVMLVMGFGSYLYITSSHYILNSKYNKCDVSRAKIISTQSIVSNSGMFFSAILMGYCAEGYYPIIFIFLASTLLFLVYRLSLVKGDFYTIEIPIHMKYKENFISYYYCFGLFAIGLIGIMYSQHRVGYPLFLSQHFGNIKTGYLMALNPLIIIFFQNFIISVTSKANELLALTIG